MTEATVPNDFFDTDEKLVNFLRNLIKNIAICHSQEISEEAKSAAKHKHEFNLVKVAQDLISQKIFNNVNRATIEEQVKILEAAVKDIMDSSILVKDQGIKELVPLSYEVLRLLLVSTNEKFRQHFFHELSEYYYYELSTNIKKLGAEKCFDKDDFDQQVKILLPVVKLETALQLVNDNEDTSQERLLEIISNLTSFFKNPRLNKEDIYAIIHNKLSSKNYELLSYEMAPLDAHHGHLGDYFTLKIDVKFKNVEMVLNLFAKFLTPALEIMKNLLKSGISRKEDFFYLTYLPLLKQHGLESLLDFSPNCYLSRLNDAMILDDMAALGFTALTLNIKVDFDCLMFVIKQIAKLHACSIIVEELLSQEAGKKVTLDDLYSEYLHEVVFTTDKDNELKEILDNTLKTIQYLAQKFPELNTTLSNDELMEKINTGWKLLFEKVKKSNKFKNAICHGDMYVGNMLFKFDPNKSCVGATLVDFQILRYCPPVQDLLFFIHQNSYKETRDKYYKELLEGYYSEISKHLANFNLDIAKIYPKEEFEESVKYMKSEAVFQALFYSPVQSLEPSVREEVLKDKEFIAKLTSDEMPLIDLGLKSDNYRRIMKGLMTEVVDLCESGLL